MCFCFVHIIYENDNLMKKLIFIKSNFKVGLIFIILFCSVLFVNCEKNDNPTNKLIGKWQVIEECSMMGVIYPLGAENRRIEEYTSDGQKILYDHLGNETGRCNYRSAKSVITIYGEEITGTKWEHSYKYWFSNDTLKVRCDGGIEFYDEFFVLIK